MSDIRVALDLEGVLAHPHAMVLDYSDRLTEEDMQTFGFSDDDLEHFLDITEMIWEEHWLDIPTTEDNLAEKVADLREFATVDLVTNTPGSVPKVAAWLNNHGIELDGYHFPGPGTIKAELDYDIYVDDNPYMPGDRGIKILYFYTQEYNDMFNGEYFLDVDDPSEITYYDLTIDDPIVINSMREDRQTVVRVDSIGQVRDDLAHRNFDGTVSI